MIRPWWVPILIVIASTAAIAETGMRTVVELVESRYAVRHHKIPGLWLARPLLIGSGVGRLSAAEFTNFHLPPQDSYSLKQELERSLGPEWHSFVEERTKGDEWSVTYTRANNKRMSMLIIESEPGGDLTVVQMNLNGNALHHWLDELLKSAKHETVKADNQFEEQGTKTTPDM